MRRGPTAGDEFSVCELARRPTHSTEGLICWWKSKDASIMYDVQVKRLFDLCVRCELHVK